MDNKRIASIGEVHWHDGLPYFLFGQSDNGFIFKDEEAYKMTGMLLAMYRSMQRKMQR